MGFDNRKYHYIYRTTNLLNGNFYIGLHSTNNLGDGYMGSGSRIISSIRHYGKENHKFKILEFHDSRELLMTREKEIINRELLTDPLCLNIMEGGYGFRDAEHLKKVCQAGNKAFIEKLKDDDYMNRFIESTKEGRERGVAKAKELYEKGAYRLDTFKGRTHTPETILKMKESKKSHGEGNKNSQFGKKWIRNLETMECIKIDSSEYEKYVSLGWESGRFPDSGGSSVKLTESQIIEIKTMLFKNVKVTEIAKIFQTSITTIRKINRGDIWNHVNINRLD
jgi:hypothetical protein